MRNYPIIRILATVLLVITSTFLFGQNHTESTERYVLIKMKSGETIIGKKLETNNTHFIIETESHDRLEIEQDEVKRFQYIEKEQIKNGKVWFKNPNTSRTLYSPTGYGLEKGEGYYQNWMIVLSHMGYGITDHITIGVGIMPFTLGLGLIASVTPKVSIPIVKNKINAGVGVQYNHILGTSMGIGYGVLTFGSKDRNFTLGSGFGFLEGEWAKRPIITASANFRLSNHFGLVSENWFVPFREYNQDFSQKATYGYEGLLTLGIRYMAKRVSVDLSMVKMPDIEFVVPMIGVTLPFRIKK